MNVSTPSSGGRRGQMSQDFDLNLAPIIDCFTVLITFLLASASFMAIGFFDAGAGIPAQAQAPAKPPAITLEVELLEGHRIHVKVSGKGKLNKDIAPAHGAQGDDWDLGALDSELKSIKGRWPDTGSVILSAKNDVEYVNVIQVMEATRRVIPAVLLGGF